MSISNFAAVCTKLRALKNGLVSPQNYEDLLKLENFEQILEYVEENTSFTKFLKSKPLDVSDMIHFERALEEFELAEYKKINFFLKSPYKELLRAIFVRTEVENIKKVLRKLYRIEHAKEIEDSIIELPIKSTLNYDKLLNASSPSELRDILRKTPYGKILEIHKSDDKRSIMFGLEIDLDKYYFRNLISTCKKLKSSEKTMMLDLIGKNLDVQNIQTLFRLFRVFDVSKQARFNYLKSGGHSLGLRKLKELAYLNNLDEFKKAISKTKYSFLLSGETEHEIAKNLNLKALRYIYSEHKKKVLGNEISLASIMLYIHEIEYTTLDLYSIIEAKKYKLKPEEIRKILILAQKGGSKW